MPPLYVSAWTVGGSNRAAALVIRSGRILQVIAQYKCLSRIGILLLLFLLLLLYLIFSVTSRLAHARHTPGIKQSNIYK